jgi:hypothetical protein
MRVAFAGLVGAAVAVSSAASQTLEEKLCILRAAQILPNIPGLTITASRTKDPPQGTKPRKDTRFLSVEIDVRAAAQDVTFSYLCGLSRGTAIAEPTGLAR